ATIANGRGDLIRSIFGPDWVRSAAHPSVVAHVFRATLSALRAWIQRLSRPDNLSDACGNRTQGDEVDGEAGKERNNCDEDANGDEQDASNNWHDGHGCPSDGLRTLCC